MKPFMGFVMETLSIVKLVLAPEPILELPVKLKVPPVIVKIVLFLPMTPLLLI